MRKAGHEIESVEGRGGSREILWFSSTRGISRKATPHQKITSLVCDPDLWATARRWVTPAARALGLRGIIQSTQMVPKFALRCTQKPQKLHSLLQNSLGFRLLSNKTGIRDSKTNHYSANSNKLLSLKIKKKETIAVSTSGGCAPQ